MKQLENERGLTLIELLAVIVILAIIAAIAAVAIGNVIQNSKDKAILSDAIAMYEGAKIAHMDNACTSEGECTGVDLQPFVDGVELGDTDKVTVSDEDGKKTYNIHYGDFTKIKNPKYKVENGIEAGELIKKLNQTK